jgi:endonuclease VIII-like 1
MPEISEVKLTAEFVTQANKNRVIKNASFLSTNKLKLIEEINLAGKKNFS